MRLLLQDLRYALRLLAKSPGSTIVIVLSLAIGIGANTAVFSVADALLLKPFPYPQADRLAVLWLRSPGLGIPQDWPSPGQYLDMVQQNHVFEEMSISQGSSLTLTGAGQPQPVDCLRTSSNLFHLLGARPLLGRLLTTDDDKRPDRVAVLTHGVWTRLFNADPNIVGKSITLNGNAVTIAGVLTHDFFLNSEIMPTVGAIEKMEILLSLPLPADAQTKLRGDENYNLMARLRAGVTPQRAQADIDAIAARIRVADKRDPTFTISVVPLLDQVVGDVRRAVLVLLGAVGLVLLIACANVANLLLSRAAARQKEIAIRTALGAGGMRVVRQLLTESVLLGMLGGAAGLVIAAWSLYIVRTINPGNIPRLESIALDGGVLAFTFGISVLTGIVFGLAPALRAARLDLNSALKAGGRASQGDGGFQISRHRLRSLLVASELAFSVVLLIGAGLLVRSFLQLQDVQPGFNPQHVISAQITLSGPKYRGMDKVVTRTFQEVIARLQRMPGVKSAGAVGVLPFTSAISWGGLQVEGYVPPPNEPELQVDQRVASATYFQTMEIPLRRGRYFADQDTADAPPVAIVDAKMAQRFWPREDAVGKRIRTGSRSPWRIVVGVVGTVKQYGLDQDLRPAIYFAHPQQAWNRMYLVARTAGDPAALSGALAREVHAVEPDAPVVAVSTMPQRIYQSLARQRFSMTMLAAFAGFAMLLGAVGIYGVMSYLVTQGTHDLGVRIALGAPRGRILGMVVRQGMTVAAVGIGAGVAGALALTRVMESLLFGVGARDIVTFAVVAAFLGGVAFVASYVPAWRATRVDPLTALREE